MGSESHSIKPSAAISVVIPCYNCADTLLRAVRSVLEQSLLPCEIILVDDASRDQTRRIMLELEGAHPDLVRCTSLSVNKGAGAARNAGWDMARGDFVAFLDADDSWHPDKLLLQYGVMITSPETALIGHQCSIDGGMEAVRADENCPQTVISAHSLLFRNCFSTPSVMVRRDIPQRFLDQQRYAEDLQLWQQIGFSGGRIVRLECVLAYLHKARYGQSGLSAQMWAMEKGELHNLAVLRRQGHIGAGLWLVATMFSVAKFLRRLVLVRIARFST